MPNNTILTTRLAAVVEVPMTEDAAPYGADSAKYPGYFHHPTLPMVLCETAAEKDALPPGYRTTPYTEEEADAYAKAAAKVEDKTDESDEPPARRSHR